MRSQCLWVAVVAGCFMFPTHAGTPETTKNSDRTTETEKALREEVARLKDELKCKQARIDDLMYINAKLYDANLTLIKASDYEDIFNKLFAALKKMQEERDQARKELATMKNGGI